METSGVVFLGVIALTTSSVSEAAAKDQNAVHR